MKELLEKTIVKVEIGVGSDDAEEGTRLVFTDSEGVKYVYDAYGDCCSATWFSHISGLRNLLGKTVAKITEREEREATKAEEAEGDYEVLSIYGYILNTSEGDCYIEFRNDSNGYYGGEAEFVGNEVQNNSLKEVREDF